MVFTAAWTILLSILFACKGSIGTKFESNASKDKALSLNISTTKNYTGEWISTFSAFKEATSCVTSDVNLNLGFKFNESNGRQTVHIRGVITTGPVKGDKLFFHPKIGSNVAILNDGRSVARLREMQAKNDTTFTHRPLNDDEVFEVRLDRKLSIFKNSMAIGVTTQDPENLIIPEYINTFPGETWLMQEENVFIKGATGNWKRIPANYTDGIKHLKVGDRLGVKKTSFGTLHFYVNGVDKGPAASNVPRRVFGLLFLTNDAVAATIVDPC